MKRRVVLLLLLLSAGAIVNVAVAWLGNLAWTRQSHVSVMGKAGGLFTPSDEWLEFARSDALLFTQLRWSAGLSDPTLNRARQERTAGRSPPRWSIVPSLPGYHRRGVAGHRSHLVHVEVGSGFPVAAMLWCGRESKTFSPTPFTPVIRLEDYNHTTTPGFPVVRLRVLPLRPIWPGFAINTLFYAMILWLLFAAPLALRRRTRIRRGLCPMCAYPVGASAVCTECGHRFASP